MRKNNRAARAARTLVEYSDVVCADDIVKFPLRFKRQREHPSVNLSFSKLNSTAFLLLYFKRNLSSNYDHENVQL